MSLLEDVKVSKRDAIKALTAAAAISLLNPLRLLRAEQRISSKLDEATGYKYSACGICMLGCGMRVMMKGDRPIFIEGNPNEPHSSGHLCPKGKASLGFFYNPDRLKTPLKRTNPQKGIGIDPGFVPISWDEALDTIVDKILEVTENGKHGERLAIFTHGEYGWATRLLGMLGSPNIVTHYDTCFITYFVARKALIGGNLWTNLEGAKYILSFGWDQLDRCKEGPARQAVRAKFDNNAKVVVFNPFQGKLGAKADEWIPIKPGTDLAVMLAMINVILTENRFNKEFVYSRTNFPDHEEVIRQHFSKYTPEWAEKISEVPAETIRRIAREFTAPENQPAVLVNHKREGPGGPNYANSHYAAHAIIILNALVGAIDREGGKASMVFGWKPKAHLKFAQNPPKLTDLIFQKKRIDGKHEFPLVAKLIPDRGIFSNVADRILNDDPYPIKMAIFRRYGLLSFPQPQKMEKALKKLDFLVFIDTMPKEIMWLADIVLPEPTFLEGEGPVPYKFPVPGKKLVKVKQKIKPLYDVKSAAAIYIELGKRLDERLGTKYFWLADEEGNPVKPVSVKDYKEAEVKELGLTYEEFLKLPNGIWVKEEPYKPKSKYKTPSGKIEIYGELMEQHGYDPLPVWRERYAKPTPEYPFYLLLRRWAGHKHSAPVTSDNPYSLDAFPEPYCWINTETARKLGIKDGDWVYVESPQGRIKLKARLTELLRPDCIMTEHDYGHTFPTLRFGGKWKSDGYILFNRPEKLAKEYRDWSSNAWMLETTVRVVKAS